MPNNPAQTPLRSTSQDHLDVEDIASDIVVLKDGSACMILEVSALNFGLLSEKEQDATIYAYAQLLNSLTFAIQIVIVSKQKDVTDYLKLLDNQLAKTTSPQIQQQLVKYRDFVKTIVRQGNVLDKKFYISLPFSSLELGVASTLGSVTKKNKGLPRPKAQIIDRATTNLSPKRDHLVRLLARIGLRARQLTSAELLQLFFDYYNRGQLGTKVRLPLYSATPL
ncbi:MAG: hypothetical protein Q7S31_02125 [bacterium]|nr:hypothetical protein [bacterium]